VVRRRLQPRLGRVAPYWHLAFLMGCSSTGAQPTVRVTPLCTAGGPECRFETRLLDSASLALTYSDFPPPHMRASGLAGEATLQFALRNDGSVEPGSILVRANSHPSFGDAATQAVSRWRFSPADQPRMSDVTRIELRLAFSLEENPCRRGAFFRWQWLPKMVPQQLTLRSCRLLLRPVDHASDASQASAGR